MDETLSSLSSRSGLIAWALPGSIGRLRPPGPPHQAPVFQGIGQGPVTSHHW
jgi:hypothetical protein